eukprot:CAMPEP_0114515028 /NCGR_PEP_ID=MMETSP0109-20121206/16491_1 /TAXON_ID=29199 /ORGANISM="Chlorarachnion reptans, Strain CCCM449" /LENGTH=144 /DNA_ID=CAMNT_0001695153 /DNA_START=69 /DNA_END=503 /DNA_ORIENTATION=-
MTSHADPPPRKRQLGCCWWCLCSCGDTIPEIEAKELNALIEGKEQTGELQIVDVRNGFEYRGGHIKGARHCQFLMPCGFQSRLNLLELNQDKPVYVICLSAHRSIAAVRALESKGFQAIHLAGGMQSWRNGKLPEIRDESKVKD